MNPRLFRNNPLPHILRTMLKLDSVGLTNCEEVHRVEIHESHVLEVEHEPACSSVNLCFQVLYVFDSIRPLSLRTVFDPSDTLSTFRTICRSHGRGVQLLGHT